MDIIHVILCGTDAFRVEGMLQGVAEMEHYAWNKKYRFSCANALSADRVDSRLLLVCNIVILCKGCRPPKDRAAYGDCPIIALPDATPACVEEVRDMESYYGTIELADVRAAAVSIALAPSHIVFDSLLQCFTPLGEAAFGRAFWLFDKNNVGLLDKDELLAWCRLTRSASFTMANLDELIASLEAVTGPCADGKMTEAQFKAIHQHWFENGQPEDAWATLHAVGTETDGHPYSWYDLHSTRIDRDVNTYLSPHAVQFFRNIYKLKGFKENADSFWRFTPGCPWAHIDGLEHDGPIRLDKFIECWKYMALERRDVVIMFARHWGYKGDTNLLFVQRLARAARDASEPLPNTLQVLVVGPRNSGRRRLIFELTSDGHEAFETRADAMLHVRTTTFYVEKAGAAGGGSEEPQTVAYTVITPDITESVLQNETANKTFDAVLLCVDGGSYSTSAQYAMRAYNMAKEAGACARMPFVLVMTKSDLLDSGEAAAAGSPETSTDARLAAFATANRLLWPPVRTSALRPEESEIAVLNEYVYSVARDPELAVGKAPLTLVKLLRRGTFTAIVVVGTLALLQKAGRWLFSRRKE